MDGAGPAPRPPLPPDPIESTDSAVQAVKAGHTGGAVAWALIAIATELGAIRRELHKRR
ncbi:hypothetical protein ABZ605_08355 [Streptomyces sp. NPDC012765]|uniref:hypothetical protein n=1 Tax=Streptomyces sp. NPDC012765 TaxID=3155249 RepID=UPI0033D50270